MRLWRTKTPWVVPATRDPLPGSPARAVTLKAVRPSFIGAHVSPPFLLVKTPLPFVPTVTLCPSGVTRSARIQPYGSESTGTHEAPLSRDLKSPFPCEAA